MKKSWALVQKEYRQRKGQDLKQKERERSKKRRQDKNEAQKEHTFGLLRMAETSNFDRSLQLIYLLSEGQKIYKNRRQIRRSVTSHRWASGSWWSTIAVSFLDKSRISMRTQKKCWSTAWFQLRLLGIIAGLNSVAMKLGIEKWGISCNRPSQQLTAVMFSSLSLSEHSNAWTWFLYRPMALLNL